MRCVPKKIIVPMDELNQRDGEGCYFKVWDEGDPFLTHPVEDVAYIPESLHAALLQEERDARMEDRKELLLDRIKRDTVAAEMAGSLLGILQFHELPFNAQSAIRGILDKWKALNDAEAARSPGAEEKK